MQAIYSIGNDIQTSIALTQQLDPNVMGSFMQAVAVQQKDIDQWTDNFSVQTEQKRRHDATILAS